MHGKFTGRKKAKPTSRQVYKSHLKTLHKHLTKMTIENRVRHEKEKSDELVDMLGEVLPKENVLY